MKFLLRLLKPALGRIALLMGRELLRLGLRLATGKGDDDGGDGEHREDDHQRDERHHADGKARRFVLIPGVGFTRFARRAPARQRGDIIVGAGPARAGLGPRQPLVVHAVRTGHGAAPMQGYLAGGSGRTLSSAKVFLPQRTATVSTAPLAGMAKLTSHQLSSAAK